MVTLSHTSRYALAKNLSLKLFPHRLYALRGGPSHSDTLLSQLFKLSLQSLRGYLELKDLTTSAEISTFAEVVAAQRYAQCRELAALVRHIDYCPDETDGDVISLRLAWRKSMEHLVGSNLMACGSEISRAEQCLEEAFLEAAEDVDSTTLYDRLSVLAAGIAAARERIMELTTGIRTQSRFSA